VADIANRPAASRVMNMLISKERFGAPSAAGHE
jgi:hypothetical protein